MKSSLCTIAVAGMVLCNGAYSYSESLVYQRPATDIVDVDNIRNELNNRSEDIHKLKVELNRRKRQSRKPVVSRGARMEVPVHNTGAKTYMDYRAITSTSSSQYKLQHSGQVYTDSDGLRRHQNGDFLVALGSFYGKVGDRLSITFEGGDTINVMIGDMKADRHTDSKNQHKNGNIVEFIVDTGRLKPVVRRMGDVSYNSDGFRGKVTKIVRQ